MRVLVDSGRFLSLPCDSEEYLVFDRKEGKYHLLRESAARLWNQIQDGGRFELEGEEEGADPVGLLSEAGLVEVVEEFVEAPVSHISRREWIGRTSKLAATAAMLPLVASLGTRSIEAPGADPDQP